MPLFSLGPREREGELSVKCKREKIKLILNRVKRVIWKRSPKLKVPKIRLYNNYFELS